MIFILLILNPTQTAFTGLLAPYKKTWTSCQLTRSTISRPSHCLSVRTSNAKSTSDMSHISCVQPPVREELHTKRFRNIPARTFTVAWGSDGESCEVSRLSSSKR